VGLRVLSAAGMLLLVLGASSAVAVYLSWRGDWPGWDEGWALVALPVGVPLAVAAGLYLERGRPTRRAVLLVSLAIWSWGALLFLAWLAI
jgi:hypothetical protein